MKLFESIVSWFVKSDQVVVIKSEPAFNLSCNKEDLQDIINQIFAGMAELALIKSPPVANVLTTPINVPPPLLPQLEPFKPVEEEVAQQRIPPPHSFPYDRNGPTMSRG